MLIARSFIAVPLLLLLLLLLLVGMPHALPGRASFQELRNLLRQQEQLEQQQQQQQQLGAEQQFSDDLSTWTLSLEQLGLAFAHFVEQCRPSGSHCTQRQVVRNLRSLRHSHRDLAARLDTLEISYVQRISEEELLLPTLRAVRHVLHQYDAMLMQVSAQAFKLINQ